MTENTQFSGYMFPQVQRHWLEEVGYQNRLMWVEVIVCNISVVF